VSGEAAFIEALRPLASHPGARGLGDDAAVLDWGGRGLVLTKDMLVEGVHYRADDPPEDVAWKLVAVNLSDLAAKGARPVAVMLGYMLGEEAWDRRFAEGLRTALDGFGASLLGGDTVSGAGGPRVLSLTAIGEAGERGVPAPVGAVAGDGLWVSGGDRGCGAGVAVLCGEISGRRGAVRRLSRARPRNRGGAGVAPLLVR
jgi:thiamine-monophosphate kinase